MGEINGKHLNGDYHVRSDLPVYETRFAAAGTLPLLAQFPKGTRVSIVFRGMLPLSGAYYDMSNLTFTTSIYNDELQLLLDRRWLEKVFVR